MLIPGVLGGIATWLDMSLHRRASRHADLLAKLPEGVDHEALSQVLADEIAKIARDDRRKLHRRLSWTSVASLTFILLVAIGFAYLLLKIPAWFGWSVWVSYPFLALLGLITAMFGVAGLSDLWEYEDVSQAGSTGGDARGARRKARTT